MLNKNLYPVVSPQILNRVETNHWPGLEIVPDGMGGEGVFMTKFVRKGTVLCNYGGILLDAEMAEEDYKKEETKFLFEFEIGDIHLFFNHYNSSTKTFGCMMNHSRIHPNVTSKLFQSPSGEPIVLHLATRDIMRTEELVHNYGTSYGNIPDCTESCIQCNPGKCSL